MGGLSTLAGGRRGIAAIAAAISRPRRTSGAGDRPGERAVLSAYIQASTRAWTPDEIEASWAASAWSLAVDAKEAVAGGSAPGLTRAETPERLLLADA